MSAISIESHEFKSIQRRMRSDVAIDVTKLGTDRDFEEMMYDIGDWSCWLIVMFILVSWPGLTWTYMESTNYWSMSSIGHCRFPDFFYSGWNTAQIRNITFRNGLRTKDACMYYDYDYESLSNKTYLEAVKFINQATVPELKSCTKDNDTYYQWSCKSITNPRTRDFIFTSLRLHHMIGLLFGGICSDIYGRVIVFRVSILIILITSTINMIFPGNFVWQMYMIEWIQGLGYSAILVSAFCFVMEFTNASTRGLLGILFFIATSIGHIVIVISLKINSVLKHHEKVLFGLNLVLLVGFKFIPESPKWLYGKGDEKRAWEIVCKIRKMNEIMDQIDLSNSPQLPFKENLKQGLKRIFEIFRHKEFNRRFLVISLMYFILEFVIRKGTAIETLELLNMSLFNYYLLLAVTETVGMLFPFILILTMEKKFASCILFAISSVIFVLCSLLKSKKNVTYLAIWYIAQLFTKASIAALNVRTAELFPTVSRGAVLALTGTISTLSGMLVFLCVEQDLIPYLILICLSCTFLSLILPGTGKYFFQNTTDEIVRIATRDNRVTGIVSCCKT